MTWQGKWKEVKPRGRKVGFYAMSLFWEGLLISELSVHLHDFGCWRNWACCGRNAFANKAQAPEHRLFFDSAEAREGCCRNWLLPGDSVVAYQRGRCWLTVVGAAGFGWDRPCLHLMAQGSVLGASGMSAQLIFQQHYGMSCSYQHFSKDKGTGVD